MELSMLPNLGTINDSRISVAKWSEMKILSFANALQSVSSPSSCACRRSTTSTCFDGSLRLLLLGEAVCGTTGSSCCSYQPCLELLNDAYLLVSVDLPLQLTSHEEVQRHEVRTLKSQGLRLDEGLAGLPQKRFDTE